MLLHRVLRDRWIVSFAAVGTVLRLAYAVFAHAPAGLGDQIAYVDAARDFAQWWMTPSAFRTPGYPAFLAVGHEVGLGLDGVRAVQALLFSAAGLIVVATAHRAFGQATARGTAAVVALYPPFLSLPAVFLPDALGAVLFSSGVCCLVVAARGGRSVPWVAAASAFVATAASVRPNLGVLLVVVLIVAIRQVSGLRSLMLTAAALTLPWLLIFGPWVGRNYALLGTHAVVGTNRVPFVLGVSLPIDTSSGRFGAFERDRHYFLDTEPRDGVRTFAQVGASDPWSVLWSNIRERPAEQLRASVFWVRELWIWPFDDRLTYGQNPLIPWPLLFASHLVVLALSLVGVVSTRRSAATRIVVFAAVTLTVPFVIIQSSPRMVAPALLVLAIPAGWALAMSARLARRAIRTESRPSSSVR